MLIERIRQVVARKLLSDGLLSGTTRFYAFTNKGTFGEVRIVPYGWLFGILPKLRVLTTRYGRLDTRLIRSMNQSLGALSEKARAAQDRFAQALNEGTASITEPELRGSLNSSAKAYRREMGESLAAAGAEAFRDAVLSRTAELALQARRDAAETFSEEPHWAGSTMLPRGLRMLYTRHSRHVAVIECEPQMRTVRFTDELVRSGGFNEEHYLSFPYTLFFIAISNGDMKGMSIFFRNQPLSSHSDVLGLVPLPNIYSDDGAQHRLCIPRPSTRSTELNCICEDAVAQYWSTSFNHDLGDGTRRMHPRIGFESLTQWENLSRRDAQCSLRFNWMPASVNAVQVAQYWMSKISSPNEGAGNRMQRLVEAINERAMQDIHAAILSHIPKWRDDVGLNDYIERILAERASLPVQIVTEAVKTEFGPLCSERLVRNAVFEAVQGILAGQPDEDSYATHVQTSEEGVSA